MVPSRKWSRRGSLHRLQDLRQRLWIGQLVLMPDHDQGQSGDAAVVQKLLSTPSCRKRPVGVFRPVTTVVE